MQLLAQGQQGLTVGVTLQALLQLSQGEKEQAMALFSKSIEMAESLNLDDLISANLTEIEKLDEEMVISLSIDKLRHSRKDLDTQQ